MELARFAFPLPSQAHGYTVGSIFFPWGTRWDLVLRRNQQHNPDRCRDQCLCLKSKSTTFISSSGIFLNWDGAPGAVAFSSSKLKVAFFFFFSHSSRFQNCKPERRFDSTNSPQRKPFQAQRFSSLARGPSNIISKLSFPQASPMPCTCAYTRACVRTRACAHTHAHHRHIQR